MYGKLLSTTLSSVKELLRRRTEKNTASAGSVPMPVFRICVSFGNETSTDFRKVGYSNCLMPFRNNPLRSVIESLAMPARGGLIMRPICSNSNCTPCVKFVPTFCETLS